MVRSTLGFALFWMQNQQLVQKRLPILGTTRKPALLLTIRSNAYKECKLDRVANSFFEICKCYVDAMVVGV